jgi:hypothetical protein
MIGTEEFGKAGRVRRLAITPKERADRGVTRPSPLRLFASDFD